jgi:hypothetical protein
MSQDNGRRAEFELLRITPTNLHRKSYHAETEALTDIQNEVLLLRDQETLPLPASRHKRLEEFFFPSDLPRKI